MCSSWPILTSLRTGCNIMAAWLDNLRF